MKTNSLLDKACMVLSIIVLIAVLSISLIMLKSMNPAADEMVFIRVTQQLPKYDQHVEWWSLMGKTHPVDMPHVDEKYRELYDRTNEHAIRPHPPVASYLMYPFVKLLYSEETPEQVLGSVEKLRQIAWAAIAFCMIAAVYITTRKCKSGIGALLVTLPLVAILPLFTVFGNNWFYNDTFMLLFLMIALAMRETKYEKFIYIPLTLMVGSKMYALLFLIPFIIENKKTALCGLVLVPYFIQCYFATGDFFYPFTSRISLEEIRAGAVPIDSDFMTKASRMIFNLYRLTWLEMCDIPYFMGIVTLPFVFLVSKGIKNKNWFLPLLFAISIGVTGLGTVKCLYRLLPAMIIGTLVIGEAISYWIPNNNVQRR